MICGRPGIPLGSIGGKTIVICTSCAEPLYSQLGALIEAMRGPRVRERRKPAISLDEFKKKLAEAVEQRGSVQVYEYAKKYYIGRKDVRKVVEELASERGWRVERPDSRKLYLRKAEAQTS